VAAPARAFGWAFAWWGVGLYWWAGWLYLRQVREVLATARTEQVRSAAGAAEVPRP